jgi:predicted AlkP superfamily pyrophosphatase or phosphodiesterase
MRSISRILVCVLLATLGLAGAQPDDSPRVLLISIDGMMPARYTSDTPARIPHIRRLMSRGVHAEGVVGIFPSVTYPSHTTLITGVRPAVHGILDNRILDPERRANGAWYWYARGIKVPTLPMAARARGLRAGAVSWPVTVGMDLDYLVPEFYRSFHPESLTLLRALSNPPHIIDAAEIAYGKPFEWPGSDRDRTEMAKYILRTYQPHVMLLHLIDLDTAQHAAGPDSNESLETLETIDGYVGEIVETIDKAGILAATNVAVVSDHGFLGIARLLQPNAAFKAEGLIEVDDRGTVTRWQAWFHSSGGSGFVYLKDPTDRTLQSRVLALLRKIQSDPANGVRKIWTRAELDAMEAHPDAAFALDVVDGFYTSIAHDALVTGSTSRGGHGFDPAREALRASFIMAGPAVKRRGSLGLVRMTQIAPTLAKMLGVGLSPKADTPLEIAR